MILKSLKYPFHHRTSQFHFFILTILAIIPFAENILLSPYATAAVSIIPIEGKEDARLETETLLHRMWIAFLAGMICLLYVIPGIVGLGIIVYSAYSLQDPTHPIVLGTGYVLFLYGAGVLSVIPLAAIHAVSQDCVFSALDLPKLLWIGFKIDFQIFFKTLIVAFLVFFLKITVGVLSLIGFGFLLVPFKAYSEYVFNTMIAVAYAGVIRSKVGSSRGGIV